MRKRKRRDRNERRRKGEVQGPVGEDMRDKEVEVRIRRIREKGNSQGGRKDG